MRFVACSKGRNDNKHANKIATCSWTDSKVTPTGISSQKVDKTNTIFSHRWEPFVGGGSNGSSRSTTLAAGNYEWPFELLLPGDTCESVEGLPEANIIYHLKATVARGKLAYDLHAKKRVRIIRTLESSALEFLHAMSVENIWPNKVEYSIVVPQKAVVFGSSIPLETRFTPLLKGLEIGDITCKLVEVHDFIVQSFQGHSVREYKKEREVAQWTVPMSREEHWQDMIEDTGQEGWVMNTSLDLPRKLGKCMQDVNVHGIKIRHKLKMVVALKNPDGHISEVSILCTPGKGESHTHSQQLRATLPVTVFISPNMPLDEEGNLVRQHPHGTSPEQRTNSIAPPGYGEHVLDQLYDEVDMSGLQTPGVQSGMNSPFYGHSRAGSAENLNAMMNSNAVPPAVLSTRLENMTLDPSNRNQSFNSTTSHSTGTTTPYMNFQPSDHSSHTSPPQSAPLSRSNSGEGEDRSGHQTPEHVDFPELSELSKVPSYATAVKTPARPLTSLDSCTLPDYRTARANLRHRRLIQPS